MRYFFMVLIVLLATQYLEAQNNLLTQIKDVDSASSLWVVYGWSKDQKNDKWSTKENEIKDIDKFENYSILSFRAKNNRSYVAIVKETKDKGLSVYDTYVLDYNDYAQQVTLWQEHSILKFSILKHHQVSLKKNEPVSKEILGLSDLSDLLDVPSDYFIFQYKFLPDSTVKFIFYVESWTADSCVATGLLSKEESKGLYYLIGTDSLYDNFFYKTIPEYFTAFTDSPLKK